MSAAIPVGTEVELLRAVATSLALIEKGKRGTVASVENGWIFVRFRTPKAVVAVMPKEIKTVEAEPATEAPQESAVSALALWALCVCLAGCFAPDLTQITLRCDGVMYFCPDGYSCIDGYCSTGGATDDGAVGAMDAGADLMMTAPDLSMSPGAAGCRSGNGTDLSGSASAYACAGTFEASTDPQRNASALCASGYKLCSRGDVLNQFVCSTTLAGFYVAEVATRGALPAASCGVARAGESAGFAGCGKSVSGVYGVPACAGFSKGIFATMGSALAVSAPYAPLDGQAQNTSAINGVLCCK